MSAYWDAPNYWQDRGRFHKKKIWQNVIKAAIFMPLVGGIAAAIFMSLITNESIIRECEKQAKKMKERGQYPKLGFMIMSIGFTICCLVFFYGFFELPGTPKANKLGAGTTTTNIIAGILAFIILRALYRLPRNVHRYAEIKTQNEIDELAKKINAEASLLEAAQLEEAALLESARLRQQCSDFFIILETETLRLVLQHIKTIVTKYEQALYRDAYGEVKADNAAKEIAYFLSDTVPNKLLRLTLPAHLSSQDYIEYLSSRLNDESFNDDLRALIVKFLNLPDGARFEEEFEYLLDDIAGTHIGSLNAAWSDSSRQSSEQTLRFLFGGDYQSLCNLARDIVQDGFKTPIPVDSIISSLIIPAELSNLKKWFRERRGHNAILESVITGEEFELFCQKRLQELGWDARTTVATGDFGADLVVERDGATIIIQCKYYSKPVGVDAVQQAFAAMTFYKAHKAAVVSNQSYTKAARQMAESNNVALLHVNELDRL